MYMVKIIKLHFTNPETLIWICIYISRYIYIYAKLCLLYRERRYLESWPALPTKTAQRKLRRCCKRRIRASKICSGSSWVKLGEGLLVDLVDLNMVREKMVQWSEKSPPPGKRKRNERSPSFFGVSKTMGCACWELGFENKRFSMKCPSSATKAPSDNSKHRNMSVKITVLTCRPKRLIFHFRILEFPGFRQSKGSLL